MQPEDREFIKQVLEEQFRELRLGLMAAILFHGPCHTAEQAVRTALELERLV